MAVTYTQDTNYSSPQTTYFAGIIHPWDDYIIIETGDNVYAAIVGKCDTADGSSVFFDKADVYVVSRSSGTGYNNLYTVDHSLMDDVTVNYSNSYYAYGNVSSDLPVINLNVSNSVTAYMLSWTVLMSLAVYMFFGLIKKICRRMFRCAR